MDLETLRKPLVYAIPGRELVAIRAELPYHTDTNETLWMNVYLPADISRIGADPARAALAGATTVWPTHLHASRLSRDANDRR